MQRDRGVASEGDLPEGAETPWQEPFGAERPVPPPLPGLTH